MPGGLATTDNPGLEIKQLRPGDWLWICHSPKLSGNQAMIARVNFQPVDNQLVGVPACGKLPLK